MLDVRSALVCVSLAALGLARPARAEDQAPTITALARKGGNLKTLVKALEVTHLDAALEGAGPFTVFAPTDEAFAALPEGTLETLVAAPEKLAAILKFHVAKGKKLAAEVREFVSATTLEGSKLAIDATDGVRVGGARVTKTDLVCSNGVVHLIDRVLIPGAPAPGAALAEPVGPRFPRLTAESLARKKLDLPGDLEGAKNLCLVAFAMRHQADVDTWIEGLAKLDVKESEAFHFYEFPTGQRLGKTGERFVDDGMRAGIPDPAARARTITLWTDKDAFLKALAIENDSKIQAILIDKTGRVLWRASGRFSEAKGKALLEALGR